MSFPADWQTSINLKETNKRNLLQAALLFVTRECKSERTGFHTARWILQTLYILS